MVYFLGYSKYCSYDGAPVSFIEHGRDLLYIFECNQQTVSKLLCNEANYKKFVKPKSGIVIFATSLHPVSWSGIAPFMETLDKKLDGEGKSVTVVIPENDFIDHVIDNYPCYRDYDDQSNCLAKMPGVAYDIVKVSSKTENFLLFEENGQMVKKIQLFYSDHQEIKAYSVLLKKSYVNSGVLYTGYEGTDITSREIRKVFQEHVIDRFVISVGGCYSYPGNLMYFIKNTIPHSMISSIDLVNFRSDAERSQYMYDLRELVSKVGRHDYEYMTEGTVE